MFPCPALSLWAPLFGAGVAEVLLIALNSRGFVSVWASGNFSAVKAFQCWRTLFNKILIIPKHFCSNISSVWEWGGGHEYLFGYNKCVAAHIFCPVKFSPVFFSILSRKSLFRPPDGVSVPPICMFMGWAGKNPDCYMMNFWWPDQTDTRSGWWSLLMRATPMCRQSKQGYDLTSLVFECLWAI